MEMFAIVRRQRVNLLERGKKNSENWIIVESGHFLKNANKGL